MDKCVLFGFSEADSTKLVSKALQIGLSPETKYKVESSGRFRRRHDSPPKPVDTLEFEYVVLGNAITSNDAATAFSVRAKYYVTQNFLLDSAFLGRRVYAPWYHPCFANDPLMKRMRTQYLRPSFTPTEPSFFVPIPDEILSEILAYTETSTTFCARLVCRKFAQLTGPSSRMYQEIYDVEEEEKEPPAFCCCARCFWEGDPHLPAKLTSGGTGIRDEKDEEEEERKCTEEEEEEKAEEEDVGERGEGRIMSVYTHNRGSVFCIRALLALKYLYPAGGNVPSARVSQLLRALQDGEEMDMLYVGSEDFFDGGDACRLDEEDEEEDEEQDPPPPAPLPDAVPSALLLDGMEDDSAGLPPAPRSRPFARGKSLSFETECPDRLELTAPSMLVFHGSRDDMANFGPLLANLVSRTRITKMARNFRGMYAFDLSQDECEISWIQQGNWTALLRAYPYLAHVTIKGSSGLVFDPIRHDHLTTLTLYNGGLGYDAIRGIVNSTLPVLFSLMMFIGVESYGAPRGTDLVQALLGLLRDPEAVRRFPALRRLGLVNNDEIDLVAEALPGSPIMRQIHLLDLSCGGFGDAGAMSVLRMIGSGPDASPTSCVGTPAQMRARAGVPLLSALDVHHNYLSLDMTERLRSACAQRGIIVDLSENEGNNDRDRYVAVSE